MTISLINLSLEVVRIITFMAISQVDGFPLQYLPLFMRVIYHAYV